MHEIESNKHAWSQISYDHYKSYKRALEQGTHRLNRYICQELGDLNGKSVIHLQCNTGADTMLLARMCKQVTGVDLVPDNVNYARQLAKDLQITNVNFIESDILQLTKTHHDTYDVVFISEGAIGWLPDLNVWGQTIRQLLNDSGYVYIFDSHPFFLALDEEKLANGHLEIKYPYFNRKPDVDDSIGGYASEAKQNVKAYFWMYTVSDVINALLQAGLSLDYFHEFTENFYDAGGMKPVGDDLYNYSFNRELFPMSFSVRAHPVSQKNRTITKP